MKRRALDLASALAKAATRGLAPVDATDLSRAEPVSTSFGLDRGTPIDRYYIEQLLEQQASLITGDVMEIGGSTYARQFGRDVRTLAVLHVAAEHPEATIVGDLCDLTTLPTAAVDCLICTQTLGFIFDVHGAVDGIHHLLRPGGVVIATVAGISQISRYDMDRWGDYWRFTDASMRRMFAPRFDSVEVATRGNVSASIALLQGIAIEDLPDRSVLDRDDPNYQLIVTVVARKQA